MKKHFLAHLMLFFNVQWGICNNCHKLQPSPVTDLHIGQIGHGLGTRAILPTTTHYQLKICEIVQRHKPHNFIIYFETSENTNVSNKNPRQCSTVVSQTISQLYCFWNIWTLVGKFMACLMRTYVWLFPTTVDSQYTDLACW